MSAEQLDLYATGIAEQLRDTGAELATHHFDEWQNKAEAVLEELARSGGVFSSEDIYEASGPAPSDGAMGALFLKAAKSGRIVNVGIVRAKRVSRHAGVVRTWRGREWA
jgi:hypothetical protein